MLSLSVHSQNHNPEFSVSNLAFGSSNYIIIGEDDSQDYGLRTEVELKYRDGAPDKGTTTLEWTSGSNKVFAYEGANSMTGFKDENRAADKADTGGAWTWDNTDQSNFDGDYIYFQGKADHVDNDGSEVSYADDTVTLQASHSDSSENFSKDFTLIKLDIDAAKVSNGVGTSRLEESKEETPGAFLPWNNDDDDYDLTDDYNQTGASGRGANTGDTDLLQIELVGVGFGSYTLDIPSNLSVWENNDRSNSVTNTTSLSAVNDRTIYVEGTSTGSGTLKVDWSDGNGLSKSDADRLNLEVFEWEGPLNVPGSCSFEYTASGVSSGGWSAVSGGTLASSGSNTSEVLWDSGPVVGTLTYAANGDYSWDLEVNVVEVKVGTSTMQFNNPPVKDNADDFLIHSSYPSLAMEATTTVDRIEGPSVNGSMRGMKFINIGFIQLVDVIDFRVDYDDLSTPKSVTWDGFEGSNNLLDGSSATTKPWYDSTDISGSDGFLDVNSDAQIITSHVFNVGDRPTHKLLSGWERTFLMDIYGNEETDRVDGQRVKYNFDLALAVRTEDSRNGADSRYFSLAHGSWRCEMSGDYLADNSNNWSPTNANGNDVIHNLGVSNTRFIIPSTAAQSNAKDILLQSDEIIVDQ